MFEVTLAQYIWYHFKALSQGNILNIHSWVWKRTKNFLEAVEVRNFEFFEDFNSQNIFHQNIGRFEKISKNQKILKNYFFVSFTKNSYTHRQVMIQSALERWDIFLHDKDIWNLIRPYLLLLYKGIEDDLRLRVQFAVLTKYTVSYEVEAPIE